MSTTIEMAAARAATVWRRSLYVAGARPANAEVVIMGGRDEPGHDDPLGMRACRSHEGEVGASRREARP